jgi:1-aminocyclopropane-1-carboxylate deaminase/D-cysteine desulfhydrase-like pyridoxal-dependent ACC family enzyme
MIKNAYFRKGSVIYTIHTGGLQGRAGFRRILA